LANTTVSLLRYCKTASGWRRMRVSTIRKGRGWVEEIKLLVLDREWRVAAKAAEMISVGKVRDFSIWLDGYNACISDDCDRALSTLNDVDIE
jgi:hypothetical protein